MENIHKSTLNSIFEEAERKAYVRELLSDFYPETEQTEDTPEVTDTFSDEEDELLERRIERLDEFFDKANDFFDRAEEAVDLISDGIIRLLCGDDEDEAEAEPKRRFPLVEGGIDADVTDKFLDDPEEKVYFLKLTYEGFRRKNIPFEPYTFDDEDKLPEIDTAEKGYDRITVEGYVERLLEAAEKDLDKTE